jgi:hypothetical protein
MEESTPILKLSVAERHTTNVSSKKSLSKWVPVEFYEVAFVPGAPTGSTRQGKRG